MAPPARDVPGPAVGTAAAPSVIVPPAPPKTFPLFGGDHTAATDALDLEPLLGRLAELALHGRTTTPVAIGFLGGPGSGKSFALRRALTLVRDLAGSAGKQGSSPFLSRVHVQPVDAAALGDDISGGLAASLYAGLRPVYPELAREIAHTARDPHVVLREVNEKLDDARRRLDSERRALDDAGSRRARLTETVLYEAAGSQVDAYARANRAGIESRFTAFGIGGEPVRSYKEFVQYVAGSGGKVGLILRALWAYKGQTKLIVTAILLVLAGIGLGIAIETQDTWLAELRNGVKPGAAVADWLAGHMAILSHARSGAFLLAALAILFNLWRAFAFVTPIFKGGRLLGADLETRRRDLDGLYAHQTKRVDTLDGDVERLTREVTEAEKRAGGSDAARHEPSPFATSAAVQAQSFFDCLAAAMAKGKTAPKRIVLAVDHLDAVAPDRARAIFDTLHRVAGAGIVVLAGADPTRLDPDGSRRGELMRWIDVPVRLDAAADRRDTGAIVARALGRGTTSSAPARNDGSASALDRPIEDGEVTMLAALAPLAGPSPRAVRRFVSLYALARLDGGVHRGALALMLALAQGGTADEKAAVTAALANAGPASSAGFEVPMLAGPRVGAAYAAVKDSEGAFSAADATAAMRAAARFSLAD